MSDLTPPPKPVLWLVTGRDGKTRETVAQTAFQAAQRCGFTLSECTVEQVKS